MVGEMMFDAAKTKQLRRTYEEAKQVGKQKHDVFYFEGHELVMDYAKYLLEYLESEFEQGQKAGAKGSAGQVGKEES